MKSFARKKLLPFLVAAALGAGVTVTHAADAEKELKIAHSAQGNVSSELHMVAWVFKHYLEENSDTLTARIYPNSALGDERAVYEGMQLGAGASCSISGTAILNNFSKRVGVIDLPFVWTGYDHMNSVLDGEVGDEIAADLEEVGLKVLAYATNWGSRNVVTAKKEVKTADDLKGLKIRTIQSPVYVDTINLMGANATPMSFDEVYTSMQTGVLDGFEHGSAVVVSNKFYEVAKNIGLTNHFLGPAIFVCAKSDWEQLSEKQQSLVMEAAALASDVNRSLAPVREAQAFDFLRDKGMNIHEVDMSDIREEAQALQDKIAEDIGAADLLAKIREAE